MDWSSIPFLEPVSRRGFLKEMGRAGAALGLSGAFAFPPSLTAQESIPGKEGMLVRSLRYLDLEMPVERIVSWITPVELFYVRNHFVGVGEPKVNPSEWRLAVTGEVERPFGLTFEDLKKFEPATVTNTMECAGNGRAFYRPHVPGIQWSRGTVGNARFAGPRLADLLRRAGIKATAKHVMFNGADEPPGNVPDFIRSIPIEKAMHSATLVATHMNGAPLTLEHGFPARALVPGWLGAASVKWLVEVRVLDHAFDGPFMKPGYCLPRHHVAPEDQIRPDDLVTITALDVKSVIARPRDGARVNLGPVEVAGAAWAGEQDIVRVEVSMDLGRTWQPADFGRDQAPFAWRLWEYHWRPPTPGAYVVLSRATDSAGRTQPVVPNWNPSGYLWNVIDQVRIHVEA